MPVQDLRPPADVALAQALLAASTMRLLALAAIGLVAVPSLARAADPPTIVPTLARDGVELTTHASYAQTSNGYAGRTSRDLDGGVAAGAGIGLRVPRWAVGLAGEIAELPGPDHRAFQTFFLGGSATYFFRPASAFGPWVGGGVGWRFASGDGTSIHGVELGRALAGADIVVPGLFAIGPIVGAALDLFPQGARSEGGRGPTLHGFGFVGLQARFDLAPGYLPD